MCSEVVHWHELKVKNIAGEVKCKLEQNHFPPLPRATANWTHQYPIHLKNVACLTIDHSLGLNFRVSKKSRFGSGTNSWPMGSGSGQSVGTYGSVVGLLARLSQCQTSVASKLMFLCNLLWSGIIELVEDCLSYLLGVCCFSINQRL
jgi:hypothetical protein